MNGVSFFFFFFSFFVPSRSLNSLTGNALHFRDKIKNKNKKRKGSQKNTPAREREREREAWGVLNVPSQDTLAEREAVKVIVRERIQKEKKKKKKTAPKTSIGWFVRSFFLSLLLLLFFLPNEHNEGKMENTRRRGERGFGLVSLSHQTTHTRKRKKKRKTKFYLFFKKHPKMCVYELERESGVCRRTLSEYV